MSQQTTELNGPWVVTLLLVLTAVVGTGFILLGPRATERSPGVVHIGVRYANEMSFEFNQYGKSGPGALIELVAPNGEVVDSFENLQIGRNLMPLQNVPNGPYTARLSAPGFKTRKIPIIVEGRMINPPRDAVLESGTLADYNLIGVRFDPTEPAE